jgi:hypothetical protein
VIEFHHQLNFQFRLEHGAPNRLLPKPSSSGCIGLDQHLFDFLMLWCLLMGLVIERDGVRRALNALADGNICDEIA